MSARIRVLRKTSSSLSSGVSPPVTRRTACGTAVCPQGGSGGAGAEVVGKRPCTTTSDACSCPDRTTATASPGAPGCRAATCTEAGKMNSGDQTVPASWPAEVNDGIAADRSPRQRRQPTAAHRRDLELCGRLAAVVGHHPTEQTPARAERGTGCETPGGQFDHGLPASYRVSSWTRHIPSARRHPGDLGRARRDHRVERAAGLRVGRVPEFVCLRP